MKRGQFVFSSNFEIVGQTDTRIIDAKFIITNSVPYQNIQTIGTTSAGIVGQITNKGPITLDAVPNALIIVYKDGIIIDKTKTDINGKYVLYLEDGIYDIKISSGNSSRMIRNYNVTGGIKPIQTIIKSGQIKTKLYDVTEFFKFDSRGPQFATATFQVSGKLVDQYGQPINQAEIIVANADQSNSVVAFCKTDEQGRYQFAIDRETYTVIIRGGDILGSKLNAKRIESYSFIPTNGFLPSILSSELQYRNGGEWIWISD